MLVRMDLYVIEETALPTAPGSPGWDDFVAVVAVRNAVEIAGYGTPEVQDPPEEMLIAWNDPEEPKRLLVVRAEGVVVGLRRCSRPDRATTPTPAGSTCGCTPTISGKESGGCWPSVLEEIARDSGMVRAIMYGVSAPGPGERLSPGTGVGSVPRDNREVRFLLARGWTLEQVERASRLALPVDPEELATRLLDATTASGPDYRVHEWVVPTPERWREDLAVLYTRMSTDAPQGALDEPEDPWTVARLEERESAAVDGPTQLLTVAIEHAPSGRLAGFTQLNVPRQPGSVVTQWDTIVLTEHRGHGLGMLMKLANFDHLQRVSPEHPSILTWNAEENRPMLDVNEAVGFVPIGYEGAWKLILSS